MAAKTNGSESVIDKTSFFWVGLCGICHPGGGPAEFDRDGKRYWDPATRKFGYEAAGKLAQDVRLDGDYAFLNTSNGELSAGRWDLTGVAEADCLMCHRADQKVQGGMNMRWVWRAGALRARHGLKDTAGNVVPAYASASAAGQGWFRTMQMTTVPAGQPPLAAKLDIDYSVGVTDGSLLQQPDGGLRVNHAVIAKKPRDYACWGCHSTADSKKRGRVWFDASQDVHYAYLNRLNDTDSANDIPPTSSTACVACHGAGLDHDFSKGRSMDGSVSDPKDFAFFRTCKDCHAASGPDRDPAAPVPTSDIHKVTRHTDALSCQFCHIPYRTAVADLAIDNATTGSTVSYGTNRFLSADPLVPTSTDKTRWYPSFRYKSDKDGRLQLFPQKLLVSAWWGDWDRKGTQLDRADDNLSPIPLWRIRGITSNKALAAVRDDNADTIPEVNTLAEIAAYMTALKGNDRYGRPVAVNPVLIKGGRLYYEDTSAASGVSSFEIEGSGLHAESSHPFGESHNVLASGKALGSRSCGECHRASNGGRDTPVFDRKVLIDPFGVDGAPVYTTVRDMTRLNPF
ncbi:MAG: hypothetical protein HYY25_13475 [Candidatus Wallbacteria bacterium]|nr:hypothetical protein [Candidatus Wallbacteria bacterium]